MNSRQLYLLFAVFAVLLGTFFFQHSSEEGKSSPAAKRLFADIENRAEDIKKIEVKQADSHFTLELKDGVWTVPSRQGYQADQNKVRSLMLKVMGLIVSQNVTNNKDNYESLGVTEEAVKAGRGSVQFNDVEGKTIGGIFLGEFRKSQPASGIPAPVGQYIRRMDQEQVYLVSDPISVVTTLTYWIDTTIANVLQAKIRSVEQYRVKNDERELEFKLTRKEGSGELELEEAGDQVANTVTLTQVRSSLENLRIEDVVRANTEKEDALEFNTLTRFFLMNGLIYEVLTAEADEMFYVKINVDFDAEYVEAERAKYEAASAVSEKDKAESEPKKPEMPELATAEQAQKLNEKEYKDWIFVLPKYLGQKFRHTRSSLFETTSS